MQNQGQRHNGPGFVPAAQPGRQQNAQHQSPARPRRTSNDFYRNGQNLRNNLRNHHSNAQNVRGGFNLPWQTPVQQQNLQEPIYLKTATSHQAPRSGHQKHGSINSLTSQGLSHSNHYVTTFDEGNVPPPSGTIRETFQNDPKAHFSFRSLHCTYHYDVAPKTHTGCDMNKSERTAYVKNVTPRLFTEHSLKSMMEGCGKVESIHYLNSGLYPIGAALVT